MDELSLALIVCLVIAVGFITFAVKQCLKDSD